MFHIKNIKSKTPTANHERKVADKQTAINWASASSEFFHGVFEIRDMDTDSVAGYYVGGKRYTNLDRAWVAG